MEGVVERADVAGALRVRRRVLVALSGPEAPAAAIDAGRLIARALAAPLHGMLVWPTPITPGDASRLLRLSPAALDGMVLDVGVGDPADAVNAATRADPVAFVVLVAAGAGCDACGLGDLAARMLAGAEAGMVVLRPGTVLSPIRRILVPLDGTPSTAAALGPAGELALCTGAALDVLMVEDTGTALSAEPGAMAPPRYCDQPQHEWPAFSAEVLQRLLSSIARCPPSVPTRLLLGTGHPAAVIQRFAGELAPDLMVLVWHGTAAGRSSVFRDVVRATTVPLLLLRR